MILTRNNFFHQNSFKQLNRHMLYVRKLHSKNKKSRLFSLEEMFTTISLIMCLISQWQELFTNGLAEETLLRLWKYINY